MDSYSNTILFSEELEDVLDKEQFKNNTSVHSSHRDFINVEIIFGEKKICGNLLNISQNKDEKQISVEVNVNLKNNLESLFSFFSNKKIDTITLLYDSTYLKTYSLTGDEIKGIKIDKEERLERHLYVLQIWF